MPRFEGRCHCGNLSYLFEASTDLAGLGLRACMCSFCRAHGARNTSDPRGSVQIEVGNRQKLVRYRFGLRTTDFLLCAVCGTYIGALLPDDGGGWFTVNVNTFREPPPFDFPLQPVVYEAEETGGRIERRKTRWTPVISFRV